MKRFLRNAFDYLIFGNWLISIAAVALTLETYLMIDKPIRIDGLIFFIFFSTLFEYNLHRHLSLKEVSMDSNPDKFNWARDNKKLFKGTLYASFLGLMASVFFLSLPIILIMVPLGLITIGYSIPLINNKTKKIRLRELPGVKILFVALVWGFTTVLLPAIDVGLSLFTSNIFFMLTRRILFVYAITIPFDIRDQEHDKQDGLRTLPIMIGDRNSKGIALLIMLVFCILIFFQYNNALAKNFSIPLYLSAITTAYVISLSSQHNGKYFHYFWVDGTMIFQFILILLFV